VVWRLGVVPYLNADPLVAAFREPEAALLVGDGVEVRAEVPSQLLRTLAAGELDTALVSVGGVLATPGLAILPEMCIASDGPVRSIVLYSRRPVREVRRVALDASSRSGVALAQVLFAEHWRSEPEFVTLPPDLPRMLDEADAAILIGNPSLLANRDLASGRLALGGVERHDLGAVWRELTGLPFVYAGWAVREERLPDPERLLSVLRRARDWGARRIDRLAARGAEELGLPRAEAHAYLTQAIHYDLGPRERAGIERFCELGIRHGVLPPTAAVRFVGLTAGVGR
jgi:chorismate dehydratase